MGRFVSVDPMGFGSKDYNLFRYAKNAPLVYVDPTGEMGIVASAALRAMIVASVLWAYQQGDDFIFEAVCPDPPEIVRKLRSWARKVVQSGATAAITASGVLGTVTVTASIGLAIGVAHVFFVASFFLLALPCVITRQR